MKIFTFGNIPIWAGGLQTSGLSNVVYQIAKNESDFDGVDVDFAATDSFMLMRKVDKLTILGWTRASLFIFIMLHPIRIMRSIIVLLWLSFKYPLIQESFIGLFFKRVFFLKSILISQPDIAHLHDISTIWYQDLVPSNIKLIVTFHSFGGLDLKLKDNKSFYKLESRVFHLQNVDSFFFISSKLMNDYKTTYGFNGKSNNVVLNSYDKSHFNYIEPKKKDNGKIILCTIASLSELKGQIRVVRAISMFKDSDLSFDYICIGSDSIGYAEEISREASNLNVSFKYLGPKHPNEIREILSEVDYMIMASSSEGFGLAYVEAIACGVPVILPKNLPIVLEKNLINSENSILLEDHSSESIVKCLYDIEKYVFDRKLIADNISNLSWENIADQYIQYSKQLM